MLAARFGLLWVTDASHGAYQGAVMGGEQRFSWSSLLADMLGFLIACAENADRLTNLTDH